MLKINNSPSYEVQASYRLAPFLRTFTYLERKPSPITSQNVSSAATIVGVFIA
ncbi:MAG: hypothetical protein WBI57_09845 [Desulfobacterales bacterium]